jgi:hypothetical protein
MAPPRNTPKPTAVERAATRWRAPPDPALERLRAAQRAEVEAGHHFDGKLTRGWFSRKLHSWTQRFDELGAWAKALATFGVAMAALAGGAARVWHFIADRRIPPAELPAGNDMPTTAIDRVPEPTAIVKKPKPPKG